MLPLLLAAGLNLLALAAPPQRPAPEPEVAVLPKDEAKAKAARKHAGPAVPVEEPAVAAAKGKPARAQAAPAETGEVPVAALAKEAARLKPVRGHAAGPEAEPEPAPRRPAAAARRVPPAEAQPIPAQDRQLAKLQTENAKLRAQLAQAAGPREVASPEAALAELEAGNHRFVDGTRVRTLLSEQDLPLREALAKGQAPFAVIITCSDSRLVDNLIFDQELGRLFTVREAGNSPDLQGLASVEYALEHLGAKLVVVMGHDHCGAVQAVQEAHGKPLPGNLWSLQAAMTGLLESTPEDPNESAASYLDRLVLRNAQRQAAAVLDRSEIVRERVAKGKVRVVSAVYDLASGKVAFQAAVPAPAR